MICVYIKYDYRLFLLPSVYLLFLPNGNDGGRESCAINAVRQVLIARRSQLERRSIIVAGKKHDDQRHKNTVVSTLYRHNIVFVRRRVSPYRRTAAVYKLCTSVRGKRRRMID